ncbi:MAG: Dihydrolipoyllysine-residue acetyltransferase component of pyruvate dehydrogenase complex [Phycisphaerae bacterium]|nr:Dihydrolipoyllysine-residue acetyltransferase component of pyruvate dehydrogenase complex [Phycisphaerae bacterium]
MSTDFKLPDLGEGIHEAQVIQVLIKEGDRVASDQPLMEVETDKAAVEIPSPQAGVIQKVHVAAGQTVNVGAALVTFADNGRSVATAPVAAAVAQTAVIAQPPPPVAEARTAVAAPMPPARTGQPAKVAASPAIRRQARENNIDLQSINGSGPGGRVTHEDLERVLAGGSAATPASVPASRPESGGAASTSLPLPDVGELPDFTKWGKVRREPIPQIRKTIANQMVRSEAVNVHVMHHDLADIEMLEQLRKDHNARKTEGDPKLTLLPFIIKAIFAAMKRYPKFNCSFDHLQNEIVYKEYFNFGIAVDTPRGLVVPVIRDIDRKSIRDLARELTALGEKARKASFTIDELRGGSFTITNIGSLGGIVSTPIINYPEVAILGLGKADYKAVVREGKVVARYMLPLNLSFDHRVIDGADAARFTGEIMGYLEVPGRLLLED